MKKMKNALFGLVSVGTVAAPVVTMVACGAKSEQTAMGVPVKTSANAGL